MAEFAEYPEDSAADDLAKIMEDFTPWSAEERQRYLDSLDEGEFETPLFASSADELDPDMLKALQSLRDGDEAPSALAAAAKDRGNTHFARAVQVKNAVYYREAAKEYTVGLRLCRAAKEEAGDEEPLALKAALHANLAACSLPLKNYGEAVRDCKAALAIDADNVKTVYRLARALLGLKKWAKARDAARWGLDLDAENKPLRAVKKKADAGVAEAAAVETKRAATRTARSAAFAAVFDAAAACGARLGPAPPKGVHAYDAFPFLEDADLRWPVVFAYPEVDAPPDLLEACPGGDLLADWLLTLFPEPGRGAPPDWDSDGAYVASSVAVYARLADAAPLGDRDAYAAYRHRRADGADAAFPGWQDRWLEVPPAARFVDLLQHPHFVSCGVVALEVRPLGSADHATWKRARTIEPLELRS